jgi:hypothetical protein
MLSPQVGVKVQARHERERRAAAEQHAREAQGLQRALGDARAEAEALLRRNQVAPKAGTIREPGG